ncbi:MAG: hypothetical protein KJZ74_02845 [Gemmatimonadales bacterium]|nr:hypothetical protein [Gemmatimonadales bacterium]
MTVKARLDARFLATFALAAAVFGASPAGAQPARQGPGPNTPKMLVQVFRSADKVAGPEAADALRDRLARAFPPRALHIIGREDLIQFLQQSGYNPNEQLGRSDEAQLAKIMRADDYIRGQVTKVGDVYRVDAWLVLTRDNSLSQPLPPSEGNRPDRAVSDLVRSIQDARKQLDNEKKCIDLARSEKYAEAVKAADEGIADYPNATLVRYCKLNVLVRQKASQEQLLAMANEILAIDPNSKNALAIAADAQKAAGNIEEANTLMVRLLATDPTNANLATQVVDGLAASGNYTVAKEIVVKAVAENPGDVGLVSLQFKILAASRDYKPAIATGEEMVQMDTSLADIGFFQRLSALYAADSQPQKAAEAMARGTRKFPNDAGSWQIYAQTLKNAGQTQQSIAAAKRALAIDPKIANGWTQIAVAYNELDQPDSALVALREASAAGDDKNTVGSFALSIGNRFYRAAVAEDPKKPASFERALPYLHFADSTIVDADAKGNAKFLIGVSSYYIASSIAQGLQASKNCDEAKMAQAAATNSMIYTQAGGKTAPDAAGQILGAIGQLSPYLDGAVKTLCKATP